MSALIIYGFPHSTFVRTVRMACVEKGAPYRLDPFKSFRFRGETHREMHPFLKMPVMRHDDVCLFETLAICCYVDETFEGPGLKPEKLVDRCRMFQWISMTNDMLYHRLVRQWTRLASQEQEPGDAARLEIRNKARDALARLDRHCAGRFLVGDTLSLADLFLAPIVACAISRDPDILTNAPAVGAYWAEVSSRESFAKTMV